MDALVARKNGASVGDDLFVHVKLAHIITPSTLPGVRPGFLEQVDRFIDDYRPALETLAKE